MQTTIEFIDTLKSLKNNCSDYRIAKILEVNPQTVSNWRLKGYCFEDKTAILVARELNLDPAYVIACIHAERSKSDDQRAVWADIAAKFMHAAVYVMALSGLGVLAHSIVI